MYQHLPKQDLPEVTKIGIFGLKVFYLVTLVSAESLAGK
jgi:hypothetical protein